MIFNIESANDVLYNLKSQPQQTGSDAMKVSREQFFENRERILEVASKLFREKGFDGVGVADIMNGAGMTHGGFYRHFSSKEDLAAKASEAALARTVEYWGRLAESKRDSALATLIRLYLSERHRDNPGEGCLFAALGSDVARGGDEIRGCFGDGVSATLATIEQMLPGQASVETRRTAIAVLAELVGAMVLARSVGDDALSKEILTAVSDELQAVCRED
jgi:TetR/AcrR family transcriptional regulator, transcriptional repressor for nem operon